MGEELIRDVIKSRGLAGVEHGEGLSQFLPGERLRELRRTWRDSGGGENVVKVWWRVKSWGKTEFLVVVGHLYFFFLFPPVASSQA